MTIAAMTEPAAEAAIVAACRALHLPTVRAEGATLADTAAKGAHHPSGLPGRGLGR
ncbi:MAG TPA: hypothetical protein VGR26_17470 [Acidimicrobiales bacterium]|nr:hypothetical protein [Acidimicrobiales bacterium]